MGWNSAWTSRLSASSTALPSDGKSGSRCARSVTLICTCATPGLRETHHCETACRMRASSGDGDFAGQTPMFQRRRRYLVWVFAELNARSRTCCRCMARDSTHQTVSFAWQPERRHNIMRRNGCTYWRISPVVSVSRRPSWA
jgi:hypothetical protein